MVLLVKLAMQSTYVKGNKTSLLVVKAGAEFLPPCARLGTNVLRNHHLRGFCHGLVCELLSELRAAGLLLGLPGCSGDEIK